MTEYISREEAIKELREVYENEYPTASGDFDEYASHDVPNILRNMKAADVQPVKHGKWELTDNPSFRKCSECGAWWSSDITDNYFTNYCPKCGARMIKEGEK